MSSHPASASLIFLTMVVQFLHLFAMFRGVVFARVAIITWGHVRTNANATNKSVGIARQEEQQRTRGEWRRQG
jgi:hypothetical protein